MPKPSPIPQLRVASQKLASSNCRTPAEVVAALGAIQAQDYGNALWAIGCRVPDSTIADVEEAVRRREIVRTWPMRRTLHFVPATDVRWMLELMTPRMIAAAAARMHQLELTEAILRRAEKILGRVLRGKGPQTRPAVMAMLEKAGVRTDSQRGIHIVSRLAMEGLVCGGPRMEKQPTFVLLDEWAPASAKGLKSLGREEALAILARRFFGGHGPATLQDFVWWTGLKVSDARAALASVETEFERIHEDGVDYWHAPGPERAPARTGPEAQLLPGFDEYLLGYRDRRHVLDAAHAPKVVPGGNGMFLPMMLRRGQVVGTWKRGTVTKAGMRLLLEPFEPRFGKTDLRMFQQAAERYEGFLGMKIADVTVTGADS